uniref:Uncharacterized protein n=1 Tax=Aliivibrio fischeri TaxID=668 RepID=H2ES79_ALIFS|nr:hypothetical protein [Aliivibrio fischeri]AEY78246.1 hypothetical protein [Aliivibrio fischeri]
MMEEHEIRQAVNGVIALRPQQKSRVPNSEKLREIKRRRDEMAFAKEIQAIEED